MNLTAEELYIRLGRLIEEMPDLSSGAITQDMNQWLGRASALIEVSGNLGDSVSFRSACNSLDGDFLRSSNVQTISAVIHRALARAELSAPAQAQGAFITAGNAYDAFVSVGKIIAQAQTQVFIVDPYADANALSEFAIQAAESVHIRILAEEGSVKAPLSPATQSWISQYCDLRPLEVRLAKRKALHDRLIFVDNKVVWSLTQSLNAFATRSPASIVRIEPDMAAMKIEAYQIMWTEARNLN